MNNEKLFLTQTINPKLQEIENLERKYFELQMCDNWDSSDYRYAEELREKIKKLKEKEKQMMKNKTVLFIFKGKAKDLLNAIQKEINKWE